MMERIYSRNDVIKQLQKSNYSINLLKNPGIIHIIFIQIINLNCYLVLTFPYLILNLDIHWILGTFKFSANADKYVDYSRKVGSVSYFGTTMRN